MLVVKREFTLEGASAAAGAGTPKPPRRSRPRRARSAKSGDASRTNYVLSAALTRRGGSCYPAPTKRAQHVQLRRQQVTLRKQETEPGSIPEQRAPRSGHEHTDEVSLKVIGVRRSCRQPRCPDARCATRGLSYGLRNELSQIEDFASGRPHSCS